MCSTQELNFKINNKCLLAYCTYTLLGTVYFIMTRRLTGKWYLKKKLFGFVVMVETVQTTTCDFDFTTSPEFTRWEKAKENDFLELGINCA